MGLSDLHCHILPGLDDGSRNFEQSLEMLRLAYDQGINRFIATPHHSSQFRRYDREKAQELCDHLQQMAREKISPEITICLGQEVFYSSDLPKLLEAGELIPMAGSKYLLVEFFPGERYQTIRRAVREITMSGKIPILAHIERYEALKEMDRVEELIHAGARMQINYGSIEGGLFDKRAAYCRKLLQYGLVHFLGTDMHNTTDRGPKVLGAMKWMRRHLDEEYLRQICGGNIDKII